MIARTLASHISGTSLRYRAIHWQRRTHDL